MQAGVSAHGVVANGIPLSILGCVRLFVVLRFPMMMHRAGCVSSWALLWALEFWRFRGYLVCV